MLISNGNTTRNIAEKQLPEYMAKGYKEVVKAATSKPAEPVKEPAKTAKKKG
jgi:hypothetical protein